jgi:hypothetical protein
LFAAVGLLFDVMFGLFLFSFDIRLVLAFGLLIRVLRDDVRALFVAVFLSSFRIVGFLFGIDDRFRLLGSIFARI